MAKEQPSWGQPQRDLRVKATKRVTDLDVFKHWSEREHDLQMLAAFLWQQVKSGRLPPTDKSAASNLEHLNFVECVTPLGHRFYVYRTPRRPNQADASLYLALFIATNPLKVTVCHISLTTGRGNGHNVHVEHAKLAVDRYVESRQRHNR